MALVFSQKKAVHMVQEKETPKKFYIFQEAELSYISGETSKPPKTKTSYIPQKKKIMNKSF